MSKAIWFVLLIGFVIGCSGSPAPNLNKMSEEEARKMREEDKSIEDEERSGSGTAIAAPKGKKK